MPIDKFSNSYSEGSGNVDVVDIILRVLNIVNLDLNKKANKIKMQRVILHYLVIQMEIS